MIMLKIRLTVVDDHGEDDDGAFDDNDDDKHAVLAGAELAASGSNRCQWQFWPSW